MKFSKIIKIQNCKLKTKNKIKKKQIKYICNKQNEIERSKKETTKNEIRKENSN